MKTFISKIKFILGKNTLKFYLMILLFLFSSVVELIGIGIIYPYIKIVSDYTSFQNNEYIMNFVDIFGLATKEEILVGVSIALVLVFVLRNIVYFSVQYMIQYNTNTVLETLRNKMFDSYIYAPYQFFIKSNSADLINKITSDTGNFTNNVYINILRFLSDTILLSVVFITLIAISFWVLPVLLFFIIFVWVFYKFSKNKTFEYGKIGTKSNEYIIRNITQSISGIKITKIHLLEKYFSNSVHTNTNNIKIATSKFWAFLIVPKLIIESMLILSIASFVIYFVFNGHDTTSLVSMLSVIGIAALRLLPSINNITNSISAIRHGMPVVNKLYDDLVELDEVSKLSQYKNEISKKLEFKKSIELKDISFRYEKSDALVLNKINIQIQKGHSIGVMGKSGAGKSTFVDVILGLLEPLNGQIVLDGIVVDTQSGNWKNLLGYVPQQIYLTDDTILANIAFGIELKKIDKTKVDEILKMVNLYEFINTLPQGVETIVGENGIRLSGGQRQRIGIARALYKDPQILIFDEATSALDSETERVVTEAIESLSDSKTMIIVAHRIETLKKCDKIYELANGNVVWIGNYEELLLKKDGEK